MVDACFVREASLFLLHHILHSVCVCETDGSSRERRGAVERYSLCFCSSSVHILLYKASCGRVETGLEFMEEEDTELLGRGGEKESIVILVFFFVNIISHGYRACNSYIQIMAGDCRVNIP